MSFTGAFIERKRALAGLGVAVVLVGAVACSGGGGEKTVAPDLLASTGAAATTALNSGGETPATGAPSGVVIPAADATLGSVVQNLPTAPAVIAERVDGSGASAGQGQAVSPVQAVGVAPEPVPVAVGRFVGSAALQPGANQQTGIWVSGTGQIDVAPDIATLNIGVEARQRTVQQARGEAATAMQSVIDAVRAQGVAADDVATTAFNIQPQVVYREVKDAAGSYNTPQIIGYIVSNTVRVTIRDLDRVGQVVDAAAEQAGDLIRINSIRFSVDDSAQFGEKLRKLAAADALAKAKIYASAMGVQLGSLLYLTETGSSAPVVVKDMRAERAFAAAAPPTPISPGDTTLTTSIQAVFAILGG